jgi:hypothetical protein
MKSSWSFGAVALVALAVAPVLLLSERFVWFLPAAWWLSGALIPSLVLSIAAPAAWLMARRLIGSKTSLEPLAAVMAAIAFAGLLFASLYITLPAALALLFGQTTSQQVSTWNVGGTLDHPRRGCRFPGIIADRRTDFFRFLCFDNASEREASRLLGGDKTISNVNGWGNDFGIYYTSIDPVGPVER